MQKAVLSYFPLKRFSNFLTYILPLRDKLTIKYGPAGPLRIGGALCFKF